ncbi:hypothetical protein AYO22_05063 [Fonsecaea multimorphosa]|nr:hypothetical protein AYO22_05063 [Fonsecaea multimorphosa]
MRPKITSFGGRGLQGHIKDRWKYLPIHPSPAHAEAKSITLHLCDSSQLQRLSWVNTVNEHVADRRILRPYMVHRKSVYLTETSLEALRQYRVDRNFGSNTPSAAAPFGESGAPQNLGFLPTPPSSPAPYRSPPTYARVANSSTTVDHSRLPARSTLLPTEYPYTTTTYIPSSSPPRPPLPSPASRPQSYLTSYTSRMPSSFPQLTDVQQQHRILYTERHHHHRWERQPLLPTMRTRTSPSATHARRSGGCLRTLLVVIILFLLIYGIYRYSTKTQSPI